MTLLINGAVVACIVAAVAKHDRSFVGLAIVWAPVAILVDAGVVAMSRGRSPASPDTNAPADSGSGVGRG